MAGRLRYNDEQSRLVPRRREGGTGDVSHRESVPPPKCTSPNMAPVRMLILLPYLAARHKGGDGPWWGTKGGMSVVGHKGDISVVAHLALPCLWAWPTQCFAGGAPPPGYYQGAKENGWCGEAVQRRTAAKCEGSGAALSAYCWRCKGAACARAWYGGGYVQLAMQPREIGVEALCVLREPVTGVSNGGAEHQNQHSNTNTNAITSTSSGAGASTIRSSGGGGGSGSGDRTDAATTLCTFTTWPRATALPWCGGGTDRSSPVWEDSV